MSLLAGVGDPLGDGLLFAGGSDGVVIAFQLVSGDLLREYHVVKESEHSKKKRKYYGADEARGARGVRDLLCFTDVDGRAKLLVAAGGGSIARYDASSGVMEGLLHCHSKEVHPKYVKASKIKQMSRLKEAAGLSFEITGMQVMPGKNRVYTCSLDGTMRVSNLEVSNPDDVEPAPPPANVRLHDTYESGVYETTVPESSQATLVGDGVRGLIDTGDDEEVEEPPWYDSIPVMLQYRRDADKAKSRHPMNNTTNPNPNPNPNWRLSQDTS